MKKSQVYCMKESAFIYLHVHNRYYPTQLKFFRMVNREIKVKTMQLFTASKLDYACEVETIPAITVEFGNRENVVEIFIVKFCRILYFNIMFNTCNANMNKI